MSSRGKQWREQPDLTEQVVTDAFGLPGMGDFVASKRSKKTFLPAKQLGAAFFCFCLARSSASSYAGGSQLLPLFFFLITPVAHIYCAFSPVSQS